MYRLIAKIKMKRVSLKQSMIAIMTIVMISCGGGGGNKQQTVTEPNVSGKIWLSANHPEFFINEAMDVDWSVVQFTVAQRNDGQVLFSDKKLGLRLASNSLTILMGTEDNMMLETIDKFNYSFDNDEFYIKLKDKTVFSSRYKLTNEKLTLIIQKPNGTETIVFQLVRD